MKKCPNCSRVYADETLNFCLDDGEILKSTDSSLESPTAIKLPEIPSEARTGQQSTLPTSKTTVLPASAAEDRRPWLRANRKIWQLVALVLILTAVGFFGYRQYFSESKSPITSIAVMPFVNETGNADVEYLSDGMTETLISNLSQLPKLNVKARSSVFRYKGKDVSAQTVGKELNVQAILAGRVVQHGDDLTLYLSLVDTTNENNIWSRQYNRKLANLIALQSEIARDVADGLGTKLSGVDEKKVARSYTENVEAYQLYLKGRYHIIKTTRTEIQTGISYFQQAIAVDPSYPLAYVGLADGYRALAVGGEVNPGENLPKAKAAAQKAIEIDDSLADAHAELGFIIFWYDWDWNAAESQLKQALALDPNSPDSHLFYAHLLSNTGRHAEALAETKRALELDPLNLRTNALGAQFVFHAGRVDEALEMLGKTLELDSNYALAHTFASSAYAEKGMLDAAISEGQKSVDSTGRSSQSLMVLGYALAKADRRAEARALLDELLKLSTQQYVRPYNIAVIYDALGDHDQAIAWLKRGYELRDPFTTFLKVDPKLNDLRDDPRFQELLRKIGFPD